MHTISLTQDGVRIDGIEYTHYSELSDSLLDAIESEDESAYDAIMDHFWSIVTNNL